MLKELTAQPNIPSIKADEAEYVSYETYLDIASDKYIMEWVDGRIITYMSASLPHQFLSHFLTIILSRFVKTLNLGAVVEAPYPTKLWDDGPAREPDILFVRTENMHKMGEMRLSGAPDLAIEIVSGSSMRQDRFHKFFEYEKAGVGEYWILDPRPRKKVAEFYVLDSETGQFAEVEPDESDIYRSTILDGLWLDTKWLWQNPLPDSQLIEAGILRSCPAVPDHLRQMYNTIYDTLTA